jgi:hypothetical protein
VCELVWGRLYALKIDLLVILFEIQKLGYDIMNSSMVIKFINVTLEDGMNVGPNILRISSVCSGQGNYELWIINRNPAIGFLRKNSTFIFNELHYTVQNIYYVQKGKNHETIELKPSMDLSMVLRQYTTINHSINLTI